MAHKRVWVGVWASWLMVCTEALYANKAGDGRKLHDTDNVNRLLTFKKDVNSSNDIICHYCSCKIM